jgi:adenine-specific DNA methylase
MKKKEERPRVLIEEWLPAAAIGVECMRERGSASALAPHTYLHVWWARRPLCVSRAAVLASLLPADFSRNIFERLLGFGKPGPELVETRRLMDTGIRVEGGFNCNRAFKNHIREDDLEKAHEAIDAFWGPDIMVMDPMAGGGSIPLESARLGFKTLANEYNPVACSILETTVDYPFRFGENLGMKAREWARKWINSIEPQLSKFYPKRQDGSVHAYIFARTVPDPDYPKWQTPLVPDWHLLKPKGESGHVVAEPVVDKEKGTWTVRIREVGKRAGQLREIPRPTYGDGKGVSIFTGYQIPADYIKAKAQAGEMKSALYAIAVKSKGLKFYPPEESDLRALQEAEKELAKILESWKKNNVIPTEQYPKVSSDERPRLYGMPNWADMFSPRQLLAMGTLVEELRTLSPEIIKVEGKELGEAVVHLLAIVIDKFLNHNCTQTRFEVTHAVIKGKMDRHDYAFKPAYAEMAPCNSGAGLDWSIDNVLEAYEDIADFSKSDKTIPVEISLGSATNLSHLPDKSTTAIVVDPPYADNVQYSELADFFYVWLKRTQGHRRPEWFSTYLCDHDQEAVVNVSRHREGNGKTKDAKTKANIFYQNLMTESFEEFRRILRDDGVLTVMFTHKKQEAWEALFTSLIRAGFSIMATWPVKTESEHSLHQARKNAAQSTVLLVARKRATGADVGYFDSNMKEQIRRKARESAERLQKEGLNPVDQLVGSFGPAMEVYSRYDVVKTDTGVSVNVGMAIDEAADAVSSWRIEQLAERGLEGVEAEGKFYLLCWDVLGAAEFRFNESKLLGHAVGMDVSQLQAAGLIEKSSDKIKILAAMKRRRSKALEQDEIEETLFGPVTKEKKRRKQDALKVHPNDPVFRTALDGCHALAIRYIEAGSAGGGIGSAKALVRQQRWSKDSGVARLMEALVLAAPEALRFEAGKKSAAAEFPEFRVWHALLEPLFGLKPPEWKKKSEPQAKLFIEDEEKEPEEGAEAEEGEESDS